MTATAAQTSLLATPLRRETGHLVELDGLRAVAIGLVLAHHLLPLHRPIAAVFPSLAGLPPHKAVPPLGFIGVSLFFVLSGFLITRILLACRERIDTGQGTLGREAGVFYLRRTLRIFPLYYGTLLVLALLDVRLIRERLAWHLTYTSNWLFSFDAAWGAGGFERHFWSLAVEEQFYLLWPWLILLTPRRLLLPGLIITFLLGPAWRAWFALRVGPAGETWSWQWTQFPTPANLDLLAAGGLLAYLWPTRARRVVLWTCLLIGTPAAGLAVGLYLSDFLIDTRRILQSTALALCFAAWVGFAGQGIPLLGKLLAWGPMVYIGKISYAMYVFHNFTPPMLRWALPAEWRGEHPWLLAWSAVGLTLLMSAASWHLFEAPINRLKRRVPYT